MLPLSCAFVLAGQFMAARAGSPLTPLDERDHLHLADTNLVVELVAAEPEVRAPVALAWDADGRMFVAEMTDYPSGPVSGRIRLLEDRDGDGRYERATVFATNLAFPNGVMAWQNGVLVTAAPDIWFLADTNGDGVADVREKVLTGFTEGNQQLRINGLYWGIDNWIYGCNGRSDGDVKWADGSAAGSIRRHDFRFRPDIKQFEVIAGNSQFGMGHDDWGNRFPVFNAIPVRHVVMEERYLERQPSLAGTDVVPSISPTNDGNRVFALTPPNLLIPQPVGFFTSACGPSIYRGTALPASYRGNYFVCEPVQNVVQRRVLKPNGSTFIAEYADTEYTGFEPAGRATLSSARRAANSESETVVGKERRRAADSAALPPNTPQVGREFLASSDPWFHGVFTATGPDGAFYIVDFYRDLVEHPHWVAPELRDKINWRKGEEHGRIWRVHARNAKPAKVEKLSRASNIQLVKALESETGWTRDTAHRLLVERAASAVTPALEKLARQESNPRGEIHALHLLDEFHSLTSTMLVSAVHSRESWVRVHAVRLSEPLLSAGNPWTNFPAERNLSKRSGAYQTPKTLGAELLALREDDAAVRLQLACTLSALPESEAKWIGLSSLAIHPQLDGWQSTAIVSGVATNPWPVTRELLPSFQTGNEPLQRLIQRLLAATSASHDTNVPTLLAWLKDLKSEQRFFLLESFLAPLSPQQRTRAIGELGGDELIGGALQAARNPDLRERFRVSAIDLLRYVDRPEAVVPLATLLERAEAEGIQVAAARTLMEANEPAAARAALSHWPQCSRVARQQLLARCVRQTRSALILLEEVEQGRVPLVEVDPGTRQALQKHRDPAVKQWATKLFAASVSADREAAVAKFRSALNLAGDRKHGAEIFERACLVCHQMQGVGAKVGPDLSGIGQHARETLLVDILDPSRQVLPDFAAYTATTSSGDTYTGYIANESTATVTLRRPNEPDLTLQRTQLNELKTSGKSPMPDGLEAGWSEQDMADLIEFLRRPDRTLFTQAK